MKKNNYVIRQMTKGEVAQIAVEWAAKEGWNPGLNDPLCFFNTDPKGFFVGLLNNEPIACISAVSYNGKFGFIGFYIVKPDYRGKGYGIKIWNEAINYLNDHNIALDGVVEQQSNYMKSSFKFAYNNIRYEGFAISSNQVFPEIVDLSTVSFNEILKYDTKLFPEARPQFVKCWIKQPQSRSFAAMIDGAIAGYGLIRKCRHGYKIGPLFSNSAEIAYKLFLALNNSVEAGEKIYLDTPQVNKYAVELAKKHDMNKVFETARMYTKFEPDIDTNKIFGVTTFELG